MRFNEALARIGGLSNPSKMPCHSYSIPATRCITGNKLRKLRGSACSACYALKGCYVFPSTRDAMARRMDTVDAMLTDPITCATWVEAFSIVLNTLRDRTDRLLARTGKVGRSDGRFFRWHDSGDLQSVSHLEAITTVADQTPRVFHWLPTREVGIVARYLDAHRRFPRNLTVRLSIARIGQGASGQLATLARHANVSVSGIHPEGSDPVGFDACAAPLQDGHCRDCRACWDPDRAVSYELH